MYCDSAGRISYQHRGLDNGKHYAHIGEPRGSLTRSLFDPFDLCCLVGVPRASPAAFQANPTLLNIRERVVWGFLENGCSRSGRDTKHGLPAPAYPDLRGASLEIQDAFLGNLSALV